MKHLWLFLLINICLLQQNAVASTCSFRLSSSPGGSNLRAAMVVTNNSDQTFDLQTRILTQPTDVESNVVRSFFGEEGALRPLLFNESLKVSFTAEEQFVLPTKQAWDFLNVGERPGWLEKSSHVVESNQVQSTVTAYGGRFMLRDKDGGSAIAKVRFRKHYTHKRGQNKADQMTPVDEDWTVLELKVSGSINNVYGLEFVDSTFKPNILVKNSVAQKLQKMKRSNFTDPEFRESIIQEIIDFPNPDGEAPNELRVRALINTLFKMGEVNHKIFRLENVVSYQRSTFEFNGENGTLIYNLDQDVKIYEPRSNIALTSLHAYFDRNAEYVVPEGVSFVELVAHVQYRADNDPRYRGLVNYLSLKHLPVFIKGVGKYSFSSTIRNHYAQSSMSTKLLTEGLFFFLIKGTANLPTPPNRKKLVEQSELEIAIPVTKHGKTHRLILHYRPFISDGERSQVLDKISMVDYLGRDVSISNSFVKELVNAALAGPDPISVSLNDEVILIPGVIPPNVTIEYNDFFSRFYTNYSKREGNPREIESLQSIETLKQLKRYLRGVKTVNALSYGWSRMHRVAMQVAISGALLGGVTYLYLGEDASREIVTEATNNAVELIASNKTDFIIDGGGSILTFNSDNGSASIFVLIDGNGGLMSLPVDNVTEEDDAVQVSILEDGMTITLYAPTGSVELDVKIDEEGLLTVKELEKAPEEEEDEDNDRD